MSMHHRHILRLAAILAALVLLFCAGCSSEEPPEFALPTPAVTPTPAPTPIPTPEPTPVPTPVPTPESNAEQLDLLVSAYGFHEDRLTDGNFRSAFKFLEGETVTVTSLDGRDIAGLYVIWTRPPGEWTLGEQLCGANGFIHEYVELDSPSPELTISAGEGARLCDVYAFTDGKVPDWVQVWQPPLDNADLLCFPTHADDEHVFFGGMLPYYGAERGLKVQVVYLTSHWAAQERPHELLDGLWTVGIRNYPVIGPFPDQLAHSLASAEMRFPREEVEAFQVEMLRRFRPSVVIGHDLNGEYGHGVHMLNAHALLNSVERAADPNEFPESAEEYGTWDAPKLYLHLYEENQITLDWSVPLETFGGKTAFEVAAEGYAMHKTQQHLTFHVYGEGDDYDSRLFGLYRTTVGPDVVGGDVFENIDNFY